MTLSEIFAQCLMRPEAERRVMTLTLSGGQSITGKAFALEGECWVMDKDHDRTWVDAGEVVAITLHDEIAKENPDPDTELALRRRAVDLKLGAELQIVWQVKPPSAEEVSAAWQMLKAIGGALEWFPDDAGKIRVIRLESANAGRFRIGDGLLEAGFIVGEPAMPVRELQSLFAAIL